eukprot:CAMPEP_0172452904 /NCGR_PEP_ID=MMETSP1065-20121228/10428_1 /TAXON_ID=265537 /ORGANISM="Amphiprora paludosa, Strain CCMP125" /LENGTH=391 /DNA_ID=CAMNT_0013205039 /DNA_START=87 /DNA_END=1262 /DNA_ORIENTATION=-
MTTLSQFLTLALLLPCQAFAPPRSRHDPRTTTTSLHDISEWRDHDFGLPGSDQLGVETGGRGPPKSVCMLPFPYDEVLLQGETKQLRLYEDRFIQLFRDVVDNHFGVVAMGLMAQSGVIQTVPLCEVEASNTMEGFGIFVTIRVVGRAQLLELGQQEPYIKATCMEITDQLPPNLELPNVLASNIETTLLALSSMEHRLNEARQNNEIEDKEMERRIAIAKLEDRFYMKDDEDDEDEKEDALNVVDKSDDDDMDAEEDDDDDDDDSEYLDRLGRYRVHYDIALSSDTQGYQISSRINGANNDDEDGTTKYERTPRELVATSWSAFCTELVPSEDATYRIQAMDADHLFERLKLAAHMLREKKAQLRVKMQKAGIKFRGEDLDEDGPSMYDM